MTRDAEPPTAADPFVRDGPTVVSYGALGAYAFCLYAFGPVLALLRSELHFSYTLISIHTSLWAAGAVLVGLTFAWSCRSAGCWSSLPPAAGDAGRPRWAVNRLRRRTRSSHYLRRVAPGRHSGQPDHPGQAGMMSGCYG